MREVILAMIVATTVATGALHAEVKRTPPPDVGPGHIAWFDISTTNLAQAKDFYGKLFGWEFAALAGTDLAVEIVSRGTSIGTLRAAEGKVSPFNGVVYVQVTDLVASCSKAAELGATVVPGFPFNLSDGRGAIALITDPWGHPVGMYSKTLLPETPAKPSS